jgi:hypothetical protein
MNYMCHNFDQKSLPTGENFGKGQLYGLIAVYQSNSCLPENPIVVPRTSDSLHLNKPWPFFVNFNLDFRKSCKIEIGTSNVRSVT